VSSVRPRAERGAASCAAVDGSDPIEFERWVVPHLASMAGLASRLVGQGARDDVVQEAVARAWQKRSTFDPSRGSPRAWLCAIVADQARKWFRRRARLARVAAVVQASGCVSGPDGGGVDLERALAALPTRMRLAVDAFYFADLSVAETAEVMKVSAGTVKSTLADARRRLRPMLEEEVP
jgi:DNA-directed RNA polymerase specialized sigma24 family protein